jgi:glycogen(starch) synthase
MTKRWLVALTELADVTAYSGGIGRTFAALLPALAERGIQVDVALLGRDDPATRRTEGLPYDVVASERTGNIPFISPLRRAWRVRELAEAEDYDAILLTEWEGLGAFLPVGAPLVTNLATSLALTQWAGRQPPTSLRERLSFALQNWLETRQIKRSAGLIGISEAIVAWNQEHIHPLPEAIVIPNCVDFTRIRERQQVGPGDPTVDTVAFLGRLEKRKGINEALAAFNKVAAAYPQARFEFIGGLGDPAKEASLEQLQASLTPETLARTTFRGHIAGDELYNAIANAALVVCPSIWEGFGNVALEIKACNVPGIFTSGSGFAETTTDGLDGLLVPPGDADALAAAIGRLLDEPDLRLQLAATALAGLDAYSPANIAELYDEGVLDLTEGATR